FPPTRGDLPRPGRAVRSRARPQSAEERARRGVRAGGRPGSEPGELAARRPGAGAVSGLRAVAVNMLGVVEHPVLGDTPYRVDADGRPYLPVGDGGLVLGVRLGDRGSALAGGHGAPGACLVHPHPASRHALVSYACIGNEAQVRTGRAAGARGVVIGKRGEDGRVITDFRQEDLARMRPGDEVTVRASGQGWRHPGVPPDVVVMNAAPGLLAALPVSW